MVMRRALICHICFLAIASLNRIAAANERVPAVSFKMQAGSLIVLPVRVNGCGPYPFVLDTGTTRTVVDAALAEELKLPRSRDRVLMTLGGKLTLRNAHAEQLAVSSAVVRELDLLVTPRNGLLSRYPGARGILGEDFLHSFDVLLDNRHGLLRLEQGSESLSEALDGQHVVLLTRGRSQIGPNENRLILPVNVPELRSETLRLQLDSGASAPVLFASTYSQRREAGRSTAALAAGFPTNGQRIKFMVVGGVNILDVFAMNSAQPDLPDMDGLLPTNLFRSIFISHSGGYAIFNPATKVVQEPSQKDPK